MSEDRILDARNRAARAEALVRDELLQEGFANLERDYLEAWRLTRPEDTRARETLYIAVNVLRKLGDHLQSVIVNGKLATAELNELIAQKRREQNIRIN